MAPSTTETITHFADQVQEKFASASLGDTRSSSEIKNGKLEEVAAPAVLAPAKVQPREPLKLSGSLDHFESFDVTPIIGREFVGVNLARWLRAPNSDELLRDLAITSTLPCLLCLNIC